MQEKSRIVLSDYNKKKCFAKQLDDFIERFSKANTLYLKEHLISPGLEKLLCEYTCFVLSPENKQIWKSSIVPILPEMKNRIDKLRKITAYAVCVFEKYRAKEILTKSDVDVDYFKNVEGSIDTEFKKLDITRKSKVLMIGVGPFPMTMLLLGRMTGAELLGLDIDAEAIEYSRRILEKLGPELNIKVGISRFDELEFTSEATHIIIASTIPEKFDILNELYTITNDRVKVAMRYGNGLKSLFNYPMQKKLDAPWRNVENIYFENNVFDIAIYEK